MDGSFGLNLVLKRAGLSLGIRELLGRAFTFTKIDPKDATTIISGTIAGAELSYDRISLEVTCRRFGAFSIRCLIYNENTKTWNARIDDDKNPDNLIPGKLEILSGSTRL